MLNLILITTACIFLFISLGNFYYFMLKLKAKDELWEGNKYVNLTLGIICLIGSIGVFVFLLTLNALNI
jgi:hypothetical protein